MYIEVKRGEIVAEKKKKRGRPRKRVPNELSERRPALYKGQSKYKGKLIGGEGKRMLIEKLVNEWFLNGNNATMALYTVEYPRYDMTNIKDKHACSQRASRLINSEYGRKLVAKKLENMRRLDDDRVILKTKERKIWLSEVVLGLREEEASTDTKIKCIDNLNKMDGIGNNKINQTNVNVNLSIEDQRKALQEEFKKSFDFIEGEFKENVEIARTSQGIIGQSDTERETDKVA